MSCVCAVLNKEECTDQPWLPALSLAVKGDCVWGGGPRGFMLASSLSFWGRGSVFWIFSDSHHEGEGNSVSEEQHFKGGRALVREETFCGPLPTLPPSRRAPARPAAPRGLRAAPLPPREEARLSDLPCGVRGRGAGTGQKYLHKELPPAAAPVA